MRHNLEIFALKSGELRIDRRNYRNYRIGKNDGSDHGERNGLPRSGRRRNSQEAYGDRPDNDRANKKPVWRKRLSR